MRRVTIRRFATPVLRPSALTSNFATDFGAKTSAFPPWRSRFGPDDDFLSIDDLTHDPPAAPLPRAHQRSRKEHKMPIGTVKFFNSDKGYGFIAPEDGGADSFVHISAVQAAGMQTLEKDQRVSYEVERGRNGKEAAVNLAQA